MPLRSKRREEKLREKNILDSLILLQSFCLLESKYSNASGFWQISKSGAENRVLEHVYGSQKKTTDGFARNF